MIVNCRGIQEEAHKCLKKGEEVSEERLKLPCGCRVRLLQCTLVSWIAYIQEEVVLLFKQNEPVKFDKY